MSHRTGNRAMPQRAAPGSPDVIAWRRRRLEQAGFDASVAAGFAADPRVDLHVLLDLVDRGCPPTWLAGSSPRWISTARSRVDAARTRDVRSRWPILVASNVVESPRWQCERGCPWRGFAGVDRGPVV